MKRNQKTALILLLILTLLFALGSTGCSSSSDIPPSGEGTSNEASQGLLSAFETTTLEGTPVDQSMLEGYDLTMVNVWATYCSPCISEMPDLAAIADEYKEQGVQVLGLASDVLNSNGELDSVQIALAEDILEETGAHNYTHIVPSPSLYGILTQIYAVPTTFFVDSQGNQVGSAYVQALNAEQFRTIIEETLAELEAQ